MNSIFITGSDTDIGKTFVTAGFSYILNKHKYSICPYKPIQSGGISSSTGLIPGDCKTVKEIANLDLSYDIMNTYCFETPVSPHLACEIENKEIDIPNIINHYDHLKNTYDCVLVEGAGGCVVPIIRNKFYITDLIKMMNLSTIVVTSTYVGSINHTCLTVSYLQNLGIEIKAIVFNGYKGNDYEDDNIKNIKHITKINNTITLPHIKQPTIENIQTMFDEHLKIDQILKILS